MTEALKARPFLKWTGGKTQLLPELLARVPKAFKRYHEPFVGGGALFWALRAQMGFDLSADLADANVALIGAYMAVRDKVAELCSLLCSHAKLHSPDYYAKVRARFGQQLGVVRAAQLIYLNKTCFNGLWRVNKAGLFNTPIGKSKSPPNICDEENLQACSLALQRTVLCARPVLASLRTVDPGDFVYLDPPYVPLSKTSNFTAYTADGFGPADQINLMYAAAELKNKGVHVLLSNAGTDEVIDMYQSNGFTVDVVQARRSINSKGDKRGAVKELLIR